MESRGEFNQRQLNDRYPLPEMRKEKKRERSRNKWKDWVKDTQRGEIESV